MDAGRLIGNALCQTSRAGNWLVTGRWEMVCARADWMGRRDLVRRIDWAFFCIRGEVDHCRNMAHWEERQAASRLPVRDVVGRLRLGCRCAMSSTGCGRVVGCSKEYHLATLLPIRCRIPPPEARDGAILE